MALTEINKNGIPVFTRDMYKRIVGEVPPEQEITDEGFLELFFDDESECSDFQIDDDLLPSSPAKFVNQFSHELLEEKGILYALNRLFSLVEPKNLLELIDLLIASGKPGKWTRVNWKGKVSYHDRINYDEVGLVFDTETFVKAEDKLGSAMPIVGQALSHKAIWMWLHPSWDGKTPYFNTFISLGDSLRVLLAHNCLPESTNVLTKSGIKSIKEIRKGDYVIGNEEGVSKWVKVLDTIKKRDECFIYGDSRFKVECTKDHRWYVQLRKHRELSSNYGFMTSEEIFNSPYNGLVISDKFKEFGDNTFINPKESRLVGWILGDGYSNCKADYIYRFCSSSSLIRDFYNRIGYVPGKELEFVLSLNKECLEQWLEGMWMAEESKGGKKFLGISQSKEKNYELWQCLEQWLEGMWMEEGSKGEKKFLEISQSKEKNYELWQCLIYAGTMLGYAPKGFWDSVRLSDRNRNKCRTTKRIKSTGVQDVYCLTTESGNFTIEQNGLVTLTGNCIYDFNRVKEKYTMDPFIYSLDTMSMVNSVHGLDGTSRMALMSTKNKEFRESREDLGCMKSLIDSYNFVIGEPKLEKADKKARNIFVEATDFQEFIDNKYELLKYSMMDIIYTFRLGKELYRRFIDWSGGHSILFGHITVIDSILPILEDRGEWVDRCDSIVAENKQKVIDILTPYAEDLENNINKYSEDSDSELFKLDWKQCKPKGWRKKKLPEGWPIRSKWYHSFLEGNFKLTGLDLPRLLQLSYNGYKLEYYRSLGWYYYDESGKQIKLPHKSGNPKDNVGNPLSSDALRWIEDDKGNILKNPKLTSDLVDIKTLHKIMRLLDANTTWSGFGDRVKSKIFSYNIGDA